MATQLPIAQDEAADEVLTNDPFALLTGMLLDRSIAEPLTDVVLLPAFAAV